jgi:hypothetical protein
MKPERIIYGLIIISSYFTLLFGLTPECKGATFIIPDDYPTIQNAIDACSNNDTVLISPGIYYENFSVNDKNIIIGSFYLTSFDTTYISSTILNGQDTKRLALLDNTQQPTRISGFTILNGYSTTGAGLYIKNSDLVIDHITIKDCHTYCTGNNSDGGAIAIHNSTLLLKNFRIEHNSALCTTPPINTYGGGIYLHSSSLILNEGSIFNNYAFLGGGIFSNESHITGRNINIIQNRSEVPGIGICAFGGEIEFSESIFTNNFGDGRVIYSEDCSISLSNCVFSQNESGIHLSDGIFIARDCTFSGNNGNFFLIASACDVHMINSIFFNNVSYEMDVTGIISIGYSTIKNGENGINVKGQIILTGPIYDFDPFFADSSCHLSEYSPCIGSGIDSLTIYPNLAAPHYDLEGSPRPDPAGSYPDLGAYEHSLANPIVGTEDRIITFSPIVCFPNPVLKTITISTLEPIYNVFIFNSLMEIALIYFPTEKTFSLDLSPFPGGIYFLQIETGKRIHTEKIILLK